MCDRGASREKGLERDEDLVADFFKQRQPLDWVCEHDLKFEIISARNLFWRALIMMPHRGFGEIHPDSAFFKKKKVRLFARPFCFKYV